MTANNWGGGRIVPRWSKSTSQPPTNLQTGEIASSLTGEAVFVGRPPLTPLVLRPGLTQQQLNEAIASETQALAQADQDLSQAIAAEASTRQQGINDLQQAIAQFIGSASQSPPANPVQGQKWWELDLMSAPLYPWPWVWLASVNRWVSDREWISTAAPGRITGNDQTGAVGLTLPPYSRVWLDTAYLTVTKNSSAYTWSLRKVLRYDNQFASLISASWQSNTQMITPVTYTIPILETLDPVTGLDWRMTVVAGQPADIRFTASLYLRVYR